MNNDILRKLIELACNNPNEAEANSAARKVCRMIKEDNFRLLLSSHYVPPQVNRYPSPQDIVNDILRREREAAARAAQENSQRTARENAERAQREATWARMNEERRKREEERARQRDKYAGTTYTEKVSNMACSRCGKVKSTFYQGPASNFMCATCKYDRDKSKRSAV